MANTLLTPSMIGREFLANLYEIAHLAMLVHRDYEADFQGKQGDTVTIRKPATFTANTFVRASGITIQDATETSVAVVLDTLLDVSFAVTAEELTLDVVDFGEQFLAPAAEAIVQGIETELLTLRADVTNTVGTDGTAITNPDTLVDAVKILRDANVRGAGVAGVIDNGSEAALLKDALFHQADQRGDTDGLREAAIGRKWGVDWYASSLLGSNAVGDAGDGLVFHRSAFALVTRTLAMPRGNVNAAVSSYKNFGVRVVNDYDITRKEDVVSVDLLIGVKTMDAGRAVKTLA